MDDLLARGEIGGHGRGRGSFEKHNACARLGGRETRPQHRDFVHGGVPQISSENMLPANSTYETDALMPFLSHIGGVSIVTFANRAALRHVDRHSACGDPGAARRVWGSVASPRSLGGQSMLTGTQSVA